CLLIRARRRAPDLQRRAYAERRGQNVLYVTKRCVFALRPEGLELVEIAPGVDIERDILARMEFRPLIPSDPAEMDARIFRPEPMGLRADFVGIPLEQRLTCDPLEADRHQMRDV